MSYCLIYFSLMFTLLMVICLNPQLDRYYLIVKTFTSLGFLLIVTIAGYLSNQIDLLVIMIPAYCFCFLGDVLLGINHYKKTNGFFLSGLISFLLGHIYFIYGLSHHHPLVFIDFMIPMGSLIVTYYLLRIDGMKVGSLKPAIYLYAFFVTLLFSKGMTVYLLEPAMYSLFFMLGAFFFMFSDLVILFLYFYEKKHRYVKVLNLSTYYLGMCLLASSIQFF